MMRANVLESFNLATPHPQLLTLHLSCVLPDISFHFPLTGGILNATRSPSPQFKSLFIIVPCVTIRGGSERASIHFGKGMIAMSCSEQYWLREEEIVWRRGYLSVRT